MTRTIAHRGAIDAKPPAFRDLWREDETTLPIWLVRALGTPAEPTDHRGGGPRGVPPYATTVEQAVREARGEIEARGEGLC